MTTTEKIKIVNTQIDEQFAMAKDAISRMYELTCQSYELNKQLKLIEEDEE